MTLLKGYGLSLYCPKPNHRPIGEIDLYLGNFWQFSDQMIHEILSIEVESGHEHHTAFCYRGIMVENYYDFINTKVHKDDPMIESKLKEFQVLEVSKVYFPSADFNAIFLIRHFG